MMSVLLASRMGQVRTNWVDFKLCAKIKTDTRMLVKMTVEPMGSSRLLPRPGGV